MIWVKIPGLIYVHKGDNSHIVSILGALPIDFPVTRSMLKIYFTGFYGSSLLWIFGVRRKITSALSCSLLLIATSLHLQSVSGMDHTITLLSQFLLLLTLWTFFYWEKGQTLKGTIAYPSWLIELSVLFLVIHYFGSGITKLIDSGPEWANGNSLQLWLFVWAKESWLRNVFIENHTLAKAKLTYSLFSYLLYFFDFARA